MLAFDALPLSLSLAARYIFHVVDRIHRFDVFLITRKHFRLIFLATITIHLSITSISCFRFGFKLKFLAFYGEAYNRIFNFSRDFELVDIASSFQNIKNNPRNGCLPCLEGKLVECTRVFFTPFLLYLHERIVATMLHNLANNRRGKANGRFLLRSESIKKFKNELNYDMKRFPRMNTSLESISPINNKKEGKRVPCVNRASHAVIVGRF